MKWLKNAIKSSLRELIREDEIDLGYKATEHIVLDPDRVNVLTIDCGQMPNAKAREYLEKITHNIKEIYPSYNLIILSKFRR